MSPSEEFILNKPEPHRSILLHLHLFILTCYPEIKVFLKYKVPFFYLNNKPLCYLNVRKNFTELGMVKGHKLTKHKEVLIIEGRSQVRSLRYNRIEEIDEEILIDILEEAISLS